MLQFDLIDLAVAAISAGLAGLVSYLIGRNVVKNLMAKAAADLEAEQRLQSELRQLLETQKVDFEKRLVDQRDSMKALANEQALNAEINTRKRFEDLFRAKDELHKKTLDQQSQNHMVAMAAQKALFEENMRTMKESLENKTNELLKNREKEFEERNDKNMNEIVAPLKTMVAHLERSITESQEKQSNLGVEMKGAIEQMMRHSQEAKVSADELARVFRHQNKVQGDWGELVLSELLGSQGLVEGVHYHTQPTMKDSDGSTLKTETGSMLRPDVILHLDQHREVVIDSKVSLSAFMDYVNEDEPQKKEVLLKTHVESLWKHVKELSAKNYATYIRPPKVKMDYVIMFVPHSGALWTALGYQPDLWRKAMEKNVYIADEQTLYAALRIINMTWTQIAQAQNQKRVFALVNEMTDRVGRFVKHYQAIGKALEGAQKAYDDGLKKLEPGGQSILQTCGKLKQLNMEEDVLEITEKSVHKN